MTQTPQTRRVALIASADGYVGPSIARMLADRGHDLVVGQPEPGLVDELTAAGAAVEAVEDVADLADPAASARLVDAARQRFGRLDAAMMSSGAIVVGRFVNSTGDDFARAVRGCFEAPYHFLRAVVPVMVEQGGGQVLVLTSASGARVTPGAPLYSAARAGATHLVRNVAGEVASHGVQVNAVGTNFMDFPGFLKASGAIDPEKRPRIEAQNPMNRLGTMEECAALCMPFLDGSAGFMTGQFVAMAGGWA